MLNIPIEQTIPKMPIIPTISNTMNYIGSIQDLKTKGNDGDVAIYRGKEYMYLSGYEGSRWVPISTTTINDTAEYSCAINDHVSMTNNYVAHPKICTQCGAPLYSCKCEYCGTMYE